MEKNQSQLLGGRKSVFMGLILLLMFPPMPPHQKQHSIHEHCSSLVLLVVATVKTGEQTQLCDAADVWMQQVQQEFT